MPGWKSEVGRLLDRLITEAFPDVSKAVKWNSPLYGFTDGTWFLGLHCYTHFVKIAFFRGVQLQPMPPGASKQPDVRYLDVREEGLTDEALFVEWVKQASQLPGVKM